MKMTKMKLNNEEINRYSRHLTLPEVGMAGQLKLKKSSSSDGWTCRRWKFSLDNSL